MRMKSVLNHSVQAIAEGSLIALLIVGLLAGTALAAPKGGGKPPSGGGGGITLQMVADTNGNGLPNRTERIHFTLTTSNTRPVVSVSCSQGGTLVYADSRPYYWPNIWDDDGIFTLSSQAWSSGAADCRAEIQGTNSRGRVVSLGSMTFYAGA